MIILDNTIQMNLFEYFLDEEQFSIKEATELVKNIKNMQVNNEYMRALIREYSQKYHEEFIKLQVK